MSIDAFVPLDQICMTGLISFKKIRNGSDEDIERAKEEGEAPDYIQWLQHEELCFRIEGVSDGWRSCEIVRQRDGSTTLGMNYGSWTEFRTKLKNMCLDHGLDLEEF